MDRINPSLADVLLIALVGFITVFVVLIVLMGIISLISTLFGESKKAPAAPAPAPTSVPVSDEVVDSYTGVKLVNVTDKEAAMIMAIVADELDKPLDNLRFISIKEVK